MTETLLFVFFMGLMLWKQFSYQAKDVYIDEDGCTVKEYKGYVFQILSIKKFPDTYELGFGIRSDSRFWDAYKVTLSRESFEDFLHCLNSGVEKEIQTLKFRNIKVLKSHPKGEGVVVLTSPGSYQQIPIERTIINDVTKDFNNSTI